MGAQFIRQRSARLAPNAHPNVVPFLDVLLVLLIVFMVTAPKPTTDLRVDLPQSRAAAAALLEPTIVSIQRVDGRTRIFVGEEETDLSSLAQRTLAHVLSADPALAAEDGYAEARIFVRADMDVAYQDVVDVLDELQTNRFERVAILAQSADA